MKQILLDQCYHAKGPFFLDLVWNDQQKAHIILTGWQDEGKESFPNHQMTVIIEII